MAIDTEVSLKDGEGLSAAVENNSTMRRLKKNHQRPDELAGLCKFRGDL